MKIKMGFLFGLILVFISCSKDSAVSIHSVVHESFDWLGTSSRAVDGSQVARLAWRSIPKAHISGQRYQELKEAGITHNVNRVLKSGAQVEAEEKLKILEGDTAIFTWEIM